MRIALGVTGCIAAYKAAEIVRAFTKKKIEVDVIMTKNASSFIAPLTFQTLSRNRVILDQYELRPDASVEHISLARNIDLLLVAPASADVINKFAAGSAEDFLTTFFISCTSPVMIAPSMNPSMYLNPVLQESLEKLKRRGIIILEPGKGEMACGEEGIGRLAEIDSVVEEAIRVARRSRSLENKEILVTAGGTREPIDAVRYISNRSSGKMGFAIAEAARRRGANVTLVSGPTSLSIPWGISFVQVETSEEMAKAVFKNASKADYIFMAAAVSDFRPKKTFSGKVKKSDGDLTIALMRTTDILSELGKKKRKAVLVGFAAEMEDILRNARSKLNEKNLDFVVVNDVSKKRIGFGAERNAVTIIDRKGKAKKIPEMYKREVAEKLLDIICPQ